ncbi:MAG TPA: hypothetical protein VFZ89_10125 [Solirubrobacteraceae bacterium]
MRTVFLSVVIGLFAATPAHARARVCDQRPGETVAATAVVRVFKDGSVLRGCRHGSRRVMRLAVASSCGLSPVAAAGRYVAVARVGCRSTTVVLFDLVRGRDVLGASAHSDATPQSVTVAELDVSRNGALAWLAVAEDGAGELHLRRPFAPAPELIAARAGGGLSDIAVTEHQLYWVQDGERQGMAL